LPKAVQKAGLQACGKKIASFLVWKTSISWLVDGGTPENFVAQLKKKNEALDPPGSTICRYPFRHLGVRGTMKVKCLVQEHNTVFLAWAQTWTARSGVKHTNHEPTAPPTVERA